MTFTSPISLFVAVLIVITLFVVGWMRRPALPGASLGLIFCGVMALGLSAGGISCRRGREPRIAVMVDVSASTRGASFRDARWLQTRVGELLGNRPFDLYTFADVSRKMEEGDVIREWPSDHTALAPPPVEQIVLFSDGRFDAPAVTPPVHVVIDAALASPTDASITSLEERGNELLADVYNSGDPRILNWVNKQRQAATAPTGSTFLSTRLVTTTETITARLSPGDLWPENDALSIRPSPPMASQRWWIGAAPPRGWMNIAPANLPLESSAWLGPAVVVVNNVAADALSPPQQDRLTQYVRDLGGALVIAGGDRAFAAGHYAGSDLELLSPLSSSPPEPATHWVLLVDSSGSMAAITGNSTRFRLASDALVTVLRELPKSDLVSIGNFSRQLRWWSVAKNVQDTATQKLPPLDVQPAGPTNLDAALKQIIASLPASPPIKLLVLSDAQADLADAGKLSGELADHHIRLSALVIGDTKSDSPLATLVNQTGGQMIQEPDSHNWTQRVRHILRAGMPDDLIHQSARITFQGLLKSLPVRSTASLNRTWVKQSAASLATADAGAEKLSAAARWTVGTGDVISLAFAPQAQEINAIEQAIARKPRDPRFSIEWHNGSMLHVRIDAHDGNGYLNDQHLSLEFGPGSRTAIPQTAPGRYEIDLPAPRQPATASILHDAHVLDRFAIAGRYAREFDAIGNDERALRDLADRSGGEVIDPSRHSQIEFPDTRQVASLAAIFAILGAMLIAGGLVAWRIA